MSLDNTKICKPVLHRVGLAGRRKEVNSKNKYSKIKENLGIQANNEMNSREAVRTTVRWLLEEV
jgi:hypothetical protein